jgi:2,3-bisphosphoglycerate-dependent phosphoglycerate mutase
MTTLYLLRHAQPAPPVVDTSKVGLSKVGKLAAQTLVPVLSSLDIQRIISSPYRRARQTVSPFAEFSGIDLEIDLRLREREMPIAESPEAHMESVRMSFQNFDYAPEGGETFREVSMRALSCLHDVVRKTPSGLLLVGHGQCLTLLLRELFPAEADVEFWRTLPVPALIELSLDEQGAGMGFQAVELR